MLLDEIDLIHLFVADDRRVTSCERAWTRDRVRERKVKAIVKIEKSTHMMYKRPVRVPRRCVAGSTLPSGVVHTPVALAWPWVSGARGADCTRTCFATAALAASWSPNAHTAREGH